jgi:hypothetical protein
VADSINYDPAGETVKKFHASNAFVRGLMGPVGSSKSSACCMEMFSRSYEQKPDRGVRKTRWGVVRNTYPELKSTTLKTWCEWFPFAQMRYDAPITSVIQCQSPQNDGTQIHMEVLFFPVDRPEEIGKLKSLELTGAWANEAGEIGKPIIDMLTQRIGRYPPVKNGGPTWSGLIMDTNPPDDDSWYYRLAEKEHPKDWEFFRQPGGLLEKDGEFTPNPEAENVPNLPGGYNYYLRQIAGKSSDWIKVFLLGQYGTIADGRPVYPEWNDEIHAKVCIQSLNVNLPLILGFDYGLTPACVICQLTDRGRLLVVAELFAKDMGIRQFARDIVKPFLLNNFQKYHFQACGDPAGVSRKDTDERTCFMELADEGIPAVPASSNTFVARREAVAKFLNKMVDGKPGILVDPACDMIRRGFNGRYQYRRLQVVGAERFKDIPDKNDYSHLHDALQYAALYALSMNNSVEWSKKIEYPKLGIV